MGLLTEFLTRIPGQRTVELTNSANPGGLKETILGGTVTVTNGSTTVTGAGTDFTLFGANIIIQFAAQPGVNYVVASITSATVLVLLQAYKGVTSSGLKAQLPSVNYVTLQNAVWDAQAKFQAVTNFPFDDVTANANTTPLTLNECIWAGIALVVAFLYDYRGLAEEAAITEAAWRKANKQLDTILHTFGDGAYASPVTDSVFQPSIGPPRLPAFDVGRLGDIDQWNPGPSTGTAGGSPSEYGG